MNEDTIHEVIFIVYMGSKRRLSKHIIPILQKYIDAYDIKTYIEPFVGGANIIKNIKCKKRVGYDINKYLTALLSYARDNELPDYVTREEYHAVRLNKDKYPDWYVGFVGFCSTYMAIFFAGYAGMYYDNGRLRDRVKETIRNIKNDDFSGIEFHTADYKTLDFQNSLIYCDPPYKGTTKYSTPDLNYEEFYDWCRKQSEKNIVVVSEYQMPDDFEVIFEKQINNALKKVKVSEKLFLIGGTYDKTIQ